MDCSGRGRISRYSLQSSVDSQTFDVYERNPSVWTGNTNMKGKPSHLAASSGLHEIEDAEDNMGGLAEEIAQSMLEDVSYEEDRRLNATPSKFSDSTMVLLSTSPQSTLAGVSSSWNLVSPSAGSTGDISSGVSSPPTPVAASHVSTDETDALDLLYAELLRLKMEDEIKVRQQQLTHLKQQQLLWKMRQRSSRSLEVSKMTSPTNANYQAPFNHNVTGPAFGHCRSKLTRSCDQDPSQSRRKHVNYAHRPAPRTWTAVAAQCTRHVQGQEQANPALSFNGRQHTSKGAVSSTGMRAVFLGAPGARECGGTGVFLPRRVGSAHDSKRKPACSTVLLPSRIVQALNLNVEDTLACSLGPSPPVSMRKEFMRHAHHSSSSAPERMSRAEVEAGRDGRDWVSAFSSTLQLQLQEVAPDVCLPTEWTY